jgi:polyisoprenoid-binding protein YceI
MRKPFIIILILTLICFAADSQQIYVTHNGKIAFTSDAPLEVIKASSGYMQAAINVSDRNFLCTVENNTFKGFNSAIQQEHFYENYMETQKYPISTFKGKIIEPINLEKRDVQIVRAKGILNIHGVEQERIIKGTIRVSGKWLIIHAEFTVPLEDHNIRIPRIVYQKIAEVIEVRIDAVLEKKQE